MEEILTALTMPAIVLALVWLTVERAVPEEWSRAAKVSSALVLGLGCVLGLHFAANEVRDLLDLPPAVAYFAKVCWWGPGVGGYVMAGVVGILAGGLAPLFHDQVVNRFAPGMKRQPTE